MTLALAIGLIVAVLAGWLILILARRVLRLAMRLTLAAVVTFLLLIGAVAWWWYGAGTSGPAARNENRPAQRRAGSR